jgi:hypothetical protein
MKIDIRPTQPHERELPWFDNTKLTAINTCPTYAGLRYHHHKSLGAGGRKLALEVGTVCHDVFAMVRLATLYYHGEDFYRAKPDYNFSMDAVLSHGSKLYTADRFALILGRFEEGRNKTSSIQTAVLNAAIDLINTSGYYDDPLDRRRTVSNIEEACITYCDRYPLESFMPVVHNAFVGVEIPIDVIISYDGITRRFKGKLDGFCFGSDGKTLEVHENKTGGRIDEVWSTGHELAYQITGYALAMSAIAVYHNVPLASAITHANLFGLAVPQPRTSGEGYRRVPIMKHKHDFDQWIKWFIHTTGEADKYIADPLNAPQYRHSCNRYFSMCQFYPFCASDPEERELIFSEMREDKWDPEEDA